MTRKSYIGFFFLIAALTVCIFVCKKQKGFHPKAIASNFSYQKEWEVDAIVPSDAFSQKFIYLGNGAQSFAFVSEDQKYVLKFFRMKHLTPKTWLNYLPFFCLKNYRFKKVYKRQMRLKETFSSFKMAYEEFKEESGLVFIHLNKTNHLKKRITLMDKKGKEYRIDLDETVFVLQEKAELIYSRISRLIEEGDLEEAKGALRSFFQLIAKRSHKKFVDKDLWLHNNYGFVGQKAIQIDIGQLMKGESFLAHSQEKDARDRVEEWLQSHYPSLLPEFQGILNESIVFS